VKSKDPAIAAGDHPLMEFYADPNGDLKVRAWDLRGNECIAWLHQVDAQQLVNFIHARKYLEKHTRVTLDLLR
jgi:hypothetical protein